jgi:hypothetical protein
MNFVYPSFLWASLAIAIPIIIHLFYFRRYKTVFFTNVRFLKEVQEESQSRRRLRNLLVLASRILAILALVFAFAQPFIPGKNANENAGNHDVSIYIDNSFSMQALSEDVPLIEKAKQRATEIISAYQPDDKFQVLSTDFEGRDQRLLSKEDALARVAEIKAGKDVKPLSAVVNRQLQALSSGKGKNRDVYMISDFQRNITDIKTWPDSTVNWTLIPLQSVQQRNVAIDSIWFEAPLVVPLQANAMIVKLQNYSDVAVEDVLLQLSLDGAASPAGTISIEANAVAYDTINLTVQKTGWHQAELTITDYPVEFDDHYHFSFFVKPSIKILHVHPGVPNKYVEAAFKNNEYFVSEPMAVGQLNYAQFKTYDLIVCAELVEISSGLAAELAQYVKDGGNLLVFPAGSANIASYNQLATSLNGLSLAPFDQTKRIVSYINYDEFIYKDVFENRRDNLKLPETQGNFKLARTANSRMEEILRYRDGSMFMAKSQVGSGNFYMCAAPLDQKFSNFVSNGEVFVPMLYRSALSRGQMRLPAYVIGKDNMVEITNQLSSAEAVYKMKGNGEEFIPNQKNIGSKMLLTIGQESIDAGVYDLYFKPEEVLEKIAFNYDRRESNLSLLNEDELETLAGEQAEILSGTKSTDFTQVVGAQSKGTPLWKLFVILTLVFLAVETLLLRFWKG